MPSIQIPLDDIQAILAAAAAFGAWTPFKHWSPPTPDPVVTLAEYRVAPIWGMGAIRVRRAGVQVRIRGNVRDPAPARAQLDVIAAALDLWPAAQGANPVVNGTTYIDIRALSSVMDMGRDANDRPLLSQNYMATWSY